MAWAEWEQLKSAAAGQHSALTQLNHADPGGGGGTLVSNKRAWAKAGEDVGSLREGVGKALGKLEDGQKGVGEDAGCLTAGAQKGVHDSWERYVKDVSGRCGKLSGLLEKVGSDLLKTDEAVGAEIGNLEAACSDTPAIGGQDKRR
ncbi:hypothetical protein GFH48_17490 [Streptomyces fagopyri]|uniref:Amino acid ABC transporter permease n=1 Tax=Streptomyces fagopyri TaxID=2662397 RepID=A0A5Q0LE48_9ACTN|nr:hypothetical protein [Streptomyces fagopyri]QFZ74827.1 hypothetical protein GFH48_17490 [Streptomyces fagopyri]